MIVKVTNPLGVANLAPLVIEFLERVDLKNMNVHSLIAVFQRTAQIGGNFAELWAIVDETEGPVGFAHWHVQDIPNIGTVHCDFIYCKGNRKDLVKQLLNECIEFGIRMNSPWYTFSLHNHPKLIAHVKNIVSELGIEAMEQPHVSFIGRKK